MPQSPPLDDPPPLAARRKRLIFRAWHRGTKEADIILGSFAERHAEDWGDADLAWFEALLEEADQDVLAWVLGRQPVPERFDTPLMNALQALDYLPREG